MRIGPGCADPDVRPSWRCLRTPRAPPSPTSGTRPCWSTTARTGASSSASSGRPASGIRPSLGGSSRGSSAATRARTRSASPRTLMLGRGREVVEADAVATPAVWGGVTCGQGLSCSMSGLRRSGDVGQIHGVGVRVAAAVAQQRQQYARGRKVPAAAQRRALQAPNPLVSVCVCSPQMYPICFGQQLCLRCPPWVLPSLDRSWAERAAGDRAGGRSVCMWACAWRAGERAGGWAAG